MFTTHVICLVLHCLAKWMELVKGEVAAEKKIENPEKGGESEESSEESTGSGDENAK